jgi:hypothetical protein
MKEIPEKPSRFDRFQEGLSQSSQRKDIPKNFLGLIVSKTKKVYLRVHNEKIIPQKPSWFDSRKPSWFDHLKMQQLLYSIRRCSCFILNCDNCRKMTKQ